MKNKNFFLIADLLPILDHLILQKYFEKFTEPRESLNVTDNFFANLQITFANNIPISYKIYRVKVLGFCHF